MLNMKNNYRKSVGHFAKTFASLMLRQKLKETHEMKYSYRLSPVAVFFLQL